jgi:uncharacterized protein VirK/YbjX
MSWRQRKTSEIDCKMSTAVHCASGFEDRAAAAGRALPEQLHIPAWEKKTWSLVRLWSIFWRGFTHLGTHREVLRFLLRHPALTEVVFGNPSFAVKYLTPEYLAQGFTVTERASCFLHHYRRLHAALPDQLLRRTLQEEVTIHQIPEGGNRFALTMGLSRPYDEEGELSLHLRVDGGVVFVLSFTIVPGWVVKSGAAEILLVTRLQGVKGCYSQISFATRTLHDVAPAALLFAALQGIAGAFGINEITAIPAARQSAYSEECSASFKEAYDDFFSQLGMSKGSTGFFCVPVPVQGKPLALIKQGHKLRTKEKRAFKQQVMSACADFFDEFAPAASHKLPL